MTIAEQILTNLKTIVADNSMDETAKYNKCLASIENTDSTINRNDRVVTYTFKDNSVLTEFNEEDFGGSVTWSINDYEDFIDIEFNDYDDSDYEI